MKEENLKAMRNFHKSVILVVYAMSQLRSCASHSLKETSWDFTAGVKSNYLQKEIKGATSGDYLMAKYRPYIVR